MKYQHSRRSQVHHCTGISHLLWDENDGAATALPTFIERDNENENVLHACVGVTANIVYRSVATIRNPGLTGICCKWLSWQSMCCHCFHRQD